MVTQAEVVHVRVWMRGLYWCVNSSRFGIRYQNLGEGGEVLEVNISDESTEAILGIVVSKSV